jgi:hypothetical protein
MVAVFGLPIKKCRCPADFVLASGSPVKFNAIKSQLSQIPSKPGGHALKREATQRAGCHYQKRKQLPMAVRA